MEMNKTKTEIDAIRSTAGVIGWRDVTDETTATVSATLKQQDEEAIDNSSAATDRRAVQFLARSWAGWRGKRRI